MFTPASISTPAPYITPAPVIFPDPLIAPVPTIPCAATHIPLILLTSDSEGPEGRPPPYYGDYDSTF